MKHTGILLTLVAALLFVACRTDNTSIQLLDQAEAMMNEAPDTALALLDSIDSHRLGRADNARYALLRSQALDKNFIDITNDSLISIAVDYYAHSHNEPYKMLAHYYYGRILFNAGDYAHSIIELLKAEKVAIDNESYFYLGLIYRLFNYIYSDIYFNTGEIEFARKSHEAFSKTDYIAHADYALLELAQSFYNNRDFSRCDSIITHLIKSQTILEDKNLCYLTYMLKSNLLINNKQYNEALALISQLEKTYGELFTAIDYIDLSTCYIAQNDTVNANKYAHKAAQIDSMEVWGLYLINKKMGKNAVALNFLEKEVDLQNKLIQNLSSQTVLSEVDEYKEQELIAANRRSKNILHTFIFASILLIFGVILAAIIRIKIVNADIEKSIALTHNLKNTLFVKDKYIEALQSDVNELFSGQFEMLNKLCAIYYEGNDEKKNIYTTYSSIKSTIKNISSDKQTISQLEMLANKHLNNIMTNFRSNYPNLSDDDNQLFLYLVMGFSPQAISIILNIDIKKVYNRKSSLKRKVCNVTDKDITQFAPLFGK